MSRAVDFYNNALKYRFIDLDLSVTLTLDEEDFLFIPGFKNTDSKARLNMPRDLFASLFYYNIAYADLIEADYTKIQYAMDSWTDVSFSTAIVDASNQIIPSSLYQHIKYDYIRFILKEITGNNSTSGLFRNTDKLLQNVVAMDSLFNSQIVSILAECGTITAPKLNTSFYNNPGRILIQSILANDNVIETDNEERRTALISRMTSQATTFYNNSTAYYIVGTVTGENSSYCYFPIYLSPTGRTAITFTDVSYTYYTDASMAQYTNLDTILIPYQVYGTVLGGTQKYYYPVYLNNLNATKTLEFTQYPGYTFYANDIVGKDASGNYTDYSTLDTNTTAYYVYGTKSGETEQRMYFPIYLSVSGIPVTFSDASYSGYPLYTDYNVYTAPTPTSNYTIQASYLDSPVQYYDVSLDSLINPITFTDSSLNGITFYTDQPNFKPVYNSFIDISYTVYGTKFGDVTQLYYYPIYLKNAVGRTDISFTDLDLVGLKFYTTNTVGHDTNDLATYRDYITSYNTMVNNATQYYVYATKTGTTYQQYYLVYLNPVANSVAITFKEYPLTFYYTKNLNHYTNYDSVSTHDDTTAYFVYGAVTTLNSAATGYYYPLYTIDTFPSTLTAITFIGTGLTMYTTTNGLVPTPVFKLAYEDFASSNYNPIIPYYIYGIKTGTDVSDNYFPIYVNYPGHICSTPITFTNYPGVTFYTNYEEVNTQFYPFEFEYGDSLSVRVTYKPKYNTYLGKEVHDYSYEVYLDMGLETDLQVPYKVLGDENTSGISVGEITYYDTKIYSSLGVAKVFHYILQNTVLPDLYTSPYNFYPTLQDISNVSFDMRSMGLGKWSISIFCRPRTQSADSYDAIGFDRFDTENSVSLLNYWTSFDLNGLTWTNGLHVGLTWANVLDIVIEPTTTPYGYIKTNGQQQIMVLAFSTDNVGYTGSIRNVVVEFKDGRRITLS